MITLKHILVATDFGEASDAALTYGRAMARTFGATLHVLHVTQNVYATPIGGESYLGVFPDLQRDLDGIALKQLDERLVDNDQPPLRTKAVVLESNTTATTIVEYAKQADVDLIIMGTHGRGAVAHLLMGSVAERVVRTAPCPVLTVRHPEREFVLPDALAVVAGASGPREAGPCSTSPGKS
jgi:nucleotide-binding universal stress UspA family protein